VDKEEKSLLKKTH